MPSLEKPQESLAVRLARTAALLFFGALAAYLIGLFALSRLALAASAWADGPALKLVIGVLVLDAGKLVGLLPVAWVCARYVSLRPAIAAPLLVGTHYALELLVMLLIQQAAWTWSPPWVALIRGALLLLLIVPVFKVLALRRPA